MRKVTALRVYYQASVPLGEPYASTHVGCEETIEDPKGLDPDVERPKLLKKLKRFVHKELDRSVREWEKEHNE